ncbi:PIN domain-containing protein [Aeromonas enteropelogenes]|uniref:PIN domain-containing protein n=1 Tax=Aeromonas enteropelogenes TaxID=29489 RepID=UPI003B9EB1EC
MTEKPLTTSLSHRVEHSKVLLIDLENCPSQINELQKNLNEYSLVVICYAHSNAKIPLDWLAPLNNTINAERLKIFKMTTNGKNAADFGINFYAGMLMQQMPSNSNFVIMSDDADLDHVVNLLRNQSRIAERIGMKKEALLNSIKNKFKDTPNITTILLPLLIKQGAVTFKENKVIYNDKKIIELSRQ